MSQKSIESNSMNNGSNRKNGNVRESFNSQWGFILACIGSAVGMGNIWMFSTRVSLYGGGAFLIPYIIFVVLIGATGVIGEMSLGRAARSGPIDAFGMICEKKGKRKLGEALGMIPVLVEDFAGAFESMASAFGNNVWQVIALAACMAILMFGVGRGIEKANKILMPVFFVLFVILGIYVFFQPGAADGYHYIFRVDKTALMNPKTWIFALGQAFFSLSVAGNGTLIYGSYLSDEEDIPASAARVALFDTIAAMLAALVIIPAMATTGAQLNQGGPGLLFVYLPNLIKSMPGSTLIAMIFFVAVLFAGMTSLINLYEAPIATVQEKLHVGRKAACLIIAAIGVVVSLMIQGIVSGWMDVLSIYICPLGAGLAGIMFFWIAGKKYVEVQVNKGRKNKFTELYFPICKYIYVPVCILVLILGIALGGIG